MFIALSVSRDEQERRVTNPSRLAFGKLVSLELLRDLRVGFDDSLAAMPAAHLSIDTEDCSPADAATRIAAYVSALKNH